MTDKPLVRAFWRFRYYPNAVVGVWGWRSRKRDVFDFGRFAYVRRQAS